MAVKNTMLAGRLPHMDSGLENIHIKKTNCHTDSRAEDFLNSSCFIAYLVLYFLNRHLLPNKFTLTQMVMFDCSFSQLCLLRNRHLILYLLKISAVLGLSSHDRPSFILSVISIPLKSVCWWGKSRDLYSVNSHRRLCVQKEELGKNPKLNCNSVSIFEKCFLHCIMLLLFPESSQHTFQLFQLTNLQHL